MKLAKILLASFGIPLVIVGACHFISRWVFGPTSQRENTLALLWGIAGILSSAIALTVLRLMIDRAERDPSVLTRADTKLLNTATKDTLVDWYISLFCWGWPSEFTGEEPTHKTGGRRSALMWAIQNRVGDYAISHKWNTVGRDGFPPHMTEEQFNEWYSDPKGYAERRLAEALAAEPDNTTPSPPSVPDAGSDRPTSEA